MRNTLSIMPPNSTHTTLKSYLVELFGEPFINYVRNFNEDKKDSFFDKHAKTLSAGKDLKFPDVSNEPSHIQEIFELFKSSITIDDL